MQPFIDVIYRTNFGKDIIINRIERMGDWVLDRKFAIDTVIKLTTGMILTGQEKCLDTTFRTLTVEYMQNPIKDEPGDWFNLAAQFYFVGYTEPLRRGFVMWVVVDWVKLVILTNNGLKWRENYNQNGRARASFRYLQFRDIPKEAIIYKSW